MSPSGIQRFVYVLEGEVTVGSGGRGNRLTADGYAYLPAGSQTVISANAGARAEVIEKTYIQTNAPPPTKESIRDEKTVQNQSLGAGLEVCSLLPENPSFDF